MTNNVQYFHSTKANFAFTYAYSYAYSDV